MKKKKKHYIDNKRFEILISEFINNDRSNVDELMGMFDLLIQNIIDSFNFKVDVDDAKQECFLLILTKLPNFSPEKGSAFNFFTTMIINNLKLIYSKCKKYNDKLDTFIEIRTGLHPSANS